MQPALDLASLDLSLGQRDRCVGALVVDGVPLVAVVRDGNIDAVHLDGEGAPGGDVGNPAGADHAHRTCPRGAEPWSGELAGAEPPCVTFFSSSPWTVRSRSSSIWGTPILRMMSAKKPCTTSRLASCSSIPRDCR